MYNNPIFPKRNRTVNKNITLLQGNSDSSGDDTDYETAPSEPDEEDDEEEENEDRSDSDDVDAFFSVT